MNLNQDYLMRKIALIIKALLEMFQKNQVDQKFLDQFYTRVMCLSYRDDLSIDFLKQMIQISGHDQDDKKAILAVCLHMKEEPHAVKLAKSLLSEVSFEELSLPIQTILKQTNLLHLLMT